MANIDAPQGFIALRGISGGEYPTMKCHVASGDSTALGIGSAVVATGAGVGKGIPTVTRATAGSSGETLGVITSIVPVTDESGNYRPASTEMYVNIALAYNTVFGIQGDSVGTTPSNGDLFNTADYIYTNSVDTIYGKSGAELDTSTIGTGDQLKIIGFVDKENNEVGEFADYEVIFLLDQLKSATGV